MAYLTFLLLSLLGSTYANNDWSKPCLSGVCEYDLPSANGAASGTLKIWGSSDSITDITRAAGWEIIDCERDSVSQDIRLVCTGDAKCEHLFKDIGAVGKIVRLPENCGPNPFAHVSAAWVSEDQSIPEHIYKRLVRRDGIEPEVKALHFDTDFAALDTEKVGVVKFALIGANVPGAEDDDLQPPSFTKRGLFDKIKNFIDKTIKQINDVSVDKSTTLPPFEFSREFTLFDESLSCPPFEAHLKVDVDTQARLQATIGVAAEGTLIPPKIEDFAVIASLTGELNGGLDVEAGLAGTIDTGKIKLYEVGIPGLDFTGILTIGPTFRVDARANANLDVNANVNLGLNYKLDKATLVFPPHSELAQNRGGAFSIANTPLQLSVSPSVNATGTVEAHIIPSLNLGISALGGIADARVFLEVDASAGMKLEIEARAEAGVIINKDKDAAQQPPQARTIDDGVATRRDLQLRGSKPIGHDFFARQTIEAGGSGNYGGCFEILAGLDVNAGATAKFFGLFEEGKIFPLFNKDFELFKRCFGDRAGIARRSLGRFATLEARSPYTQRNTTELERRLTCPLFPQGEELESLLNELILSTNVKPLN